MLKTPESYNRAFWSAMRGEDVFNVALNESADTEAYFSPSEFRERMNKALANRNAFRRLGTVVTLSVAEGTFQAIASTAMAAWTADGTAIPDATDAFTKFRVRSHKLASLSKLREAFVSDMAFDIEGYLSGDFAYRFARAEEDACINGDGSTRPTGILHETGGEIALTTDAADKITYDEVVRLYYSLNAEYRENAVFLMHDDTAMHLRMLKDEAGNPLWRTNDDTIFGKPVITSPFMPTMTAGAKSIAFGDLSFYWLIERQPLSIRRLSELYARQGAIGFLAFERLDGRLIRPEAVKVLQQKA